MPTTTITGPDIQPIWAPEGRSPLLTPAEAARYLRTTEKALQQMRDKGMGPDYIRPNLRRVLYPLDVLDRYLADHTVHPSATRERIDHA